ncbi:hypothetical protein BDL97_16G077600 [Sphagnum fallax]|nr:hypothetical protein BDL97_16G077600 [Sphagnum fallax]KAH8938338.1 hypothetical protein BDL97_16G077600 [Sphagnum fallax]KAH8938345.1 hypothetical protein BDL97_16G077600 [Sphagnum fallax]
MFLSRGRLMASAKKHGSAPLRGPVLCDAIVKAELKEEDVKRERIMEPNDCIADAKPGASFESLLSSFKYTKPRNVPLKRECSDFLEDKAKGGSRVLDSVLQVDIEDTGPLMSRKIAKVASPSFNKKVLQARTKSGRPTNLPNEVPENWQAIIDKIRCIRVDRDAPVDLFGTHQLMDATADKETQKFHALVAAMISSQTRDAVTSAAMQRLQRVPGGLSVANIATDEVSMDTLAEILKPVGFYRQKAKYLKSIAQILLRSPYNGLVPGTMEDLMKLPGVGPKVALLVLFVAFGMGEEGMIVDTNVKRVCQRLGWVAEKATPEQTRQTLQSWLPSSLWADISFLFVGFGQQVCKPRGPLCSLCTVNQMCPSACDPKKNK